MEEEVYIPICWPDIQLYMDKEGFSENCFLIDCHNGIEIFGDSAYFCNKAWIKEVDVLLYEFDKNLSDADLY